MRNRILGLMALAWVTVGAFAQNPMQLQAGGTEVRVEFYTPSIVHIVKGQPTKTLVVTAQPEAVEVNRNGSILSSKTLTVKVDPKTGAITFSAKGKVLLREKTFALTPITTGNDAGKYQVQQVFTLDKDEAIYGLGTIQNGKMNRRGEHKRMEQSNLEDFQNVLQSIKGWGL